MIVNIKYFKMTGKYYADGEYETKHSLIEDVVSEIKTMKRHPGLQNYWDGYILVSGYCPHLIALESHT
jgi:hypothetical protein